MTFSEEYRQLKSQYFIFILQFLNNFTILINPLKKKKKTIEQNPTFIWVDLLDMKFVVLPFYNYLGSIPPYYTVNFIFKNSSISRIKFFFLISWPPTWNMGLSSLARDWTCPSFGSSKSQPLDHQGEPENFELFDEWKITLTLDSIYKVTLQMCPSSILYDSSEQVNVGGSLEVYQISLPVSYLIK